MNKTPEWIGSLKPQAPDGSSILASERQSSNLDCEHLSNFLFSREALQQRARILAILQADPLFDKKHDAFDGRVAKMKRSLVRGKRLKQIAQRNHWSSGDYQVASELLGDATPYKLHEGMFIKTLQEQGTPEQHKLFLRKAETYEIVGCYAQTELGHGSNVRGLETTATWQPETRTFVLNSPTLTAAKWWIGSLGRTANHAVVMAQLFIQGISYGPHPFILQIRDLETHKPLKNIHVGDIGPKFGLNSLDNGFLFIQNVEIPHVNMLARFSHVNPDTNTYIRPMNASLVYGTMTWVRSNIVLNAGATLAQGLTIAIRYCATRRQFQDPDVQGAQRESAVLNYSMVQYRLFPLLAAAFAMHFAGRKMLNLYRANQEEIAKMTPKAGDSKHSKGQRSVLQAELHAASCALKALTSTITGEGLETCRRACGGHGYSDFAGIGRIYAEYLPTLTWEGDNYMLTQQVSRYLLNCARQVSHKASSQIPGGKNSTKQMLSDFLVEREGWTPLDIKGKPSTILKAFAHRVASMTFSILEKVDTEKRQHNRMLIDFWRLSTAYAQYRVVDNFSQGIEDARQHAGLRNGSGDTLGVLKKLYQLWTLQTILNESSEFLDTGAFSAEQFAIGKEQVVSLLGEIRPHAVPLVDAWKISDYQLNSSLGRYDGAVYEDLFFRANELNPLNGVDFNIGLNSDVLFRNQVLGEAKL